ncbi:hypothetical protein SKB0092_43150 (plasmid) [Roseomonas mucosa]
MRSFAGEIPRPWGNHSGAFGSGQAGPVTPKSLTAFALAQSRAAMGAWVQAVSSAVRGILEKACTAAADPSCKATDATAACAQERGSIP